MSYSKFPIYSFRHLCKKNKPPIGFVHGFSYCKLTKVLKADFSQQSFSNKGFLKPRLISSNFKGNTVTDFEGDSVNQIGYLANELIKIKSISNNIIDKLRLEVKSFGRHVNDNNFNPIFLDVCRTENFFSIGKDFFYLLYSQKKCNIATIGKFFRLCHDFPSECSEDDKSFLIKLYNDLISKYTILDSRSCENFALGLAITKKWKEGIRLIEMTHMTSTPSTKLYSAVIESAFLNKEGQIAQDLLKKMATQNRSPLLGVYKIWMESSQYSRSTYYEMLAFMEKYNIHPLEDVADLLINLSKKLKPPLQQHTISSINPKGTCRSCRKPLKSISLTEEEFVKLRNTFLDPVLIGKNIFLKTKPEELESFLTFIDKIKQVDFVLDGLNIAYAKDHSSNDKGKASRNLREVVEHFVKLGKNVAVIGRKHMMSWHKNNMNYIMQNSNLFLAENVSADDPFLLYTALYSGLGTCFVSRDQMRGHKFLLRGSEMDNIFSRWQQNHQYYFNYITPMGEVSLIKPLPYLQCPQESEPGVWHIPISMPMDGVQPHLVASRTKWLCLR